VIVEEEYCSVGVQLVFTFYRVCATEKCSAQTVQVVVVAVAVVVVVVVVLC